MHQRPLDWSYTMNQALVVRTENCLPPPEGLPGPLKSTWQRRPKLWTARTKATCAATLWPREVRLNSLRYCGQQVRPNVRRSWDKKQSKICCDAVNIKCGKVCGDAVDNNSGTKCADDADKKQGKTRAMLWTRSQAKFVATL